MSLISQYKFHDSDANTTVLDSKGNNNGVASENTNLFTSEGMLLKSFLFNGSRKVVVPHDESLSMTTNLSIAFYIRKLGLTSGRDYIVAKRLTDSSPDNYNLEIFSDKLEFWIHTTAGSWTGWQAENIIIEGWEHWAITFDEGVVQFYRNGELETTNLIFGSIQNMETNTEDLIIGGNSSSNANGLNAELEELWIYDQTISQDAVKSIINHYPPRSDLNVKDKSRLGRALGR